MKHDYLTVQSEGAATTEAIPDYSDCFADFDKVLIKSLRRNFILKNIDLGDVELAKMMKLSGMYSETTYLSDIARAIRNIQRKLRLSEHGHSDTRRN